MKILECRICNSKNLSIVIYLGNQKITSIFKKYGEHNNNDSYPVNLCMCENCGLIQSEETTPLDDMYKKNNYGYRSSISNTMINHLKKYHQEILEKINLNNGDIVIDIGSNDSTFLHFYHDNIRRIGVDPTGNQFKQFYHDLELIPDYFNLDIVIKNAGNIKCKVITSICVLYDLPNPVQFAKDIYDLLDEDGIWTCEQSYLLDMLKTNGLDTICHEHLEYYALTQIIEIASRANLKIIDVNFNSSNGGSFRIYFARKESTRFFECTTLISEILEEENKYMLKDKETYINFVKNCDTELKKLTDFIKCINNNKKKAYIYGASTKGNCILQYCNITENEVKYAVERNPEKIGLSTNTGIEIIDEETMRQNPPDYLIVLPWHFKDEIIKREHKYLDDGGQLVFYFPTFEIIEKKHLQIYTPSIEEYKKSALDAINTSWISHFGKYSDLANNKLKEITKTKYSILMANGTCATHCLFIALKFKYPNINKIYVPNNCYVAALNCALMEYKIEQLEPLKMDDTTWNICTDEEYFKSLSTNSAVIIVHNLGNIINVPRLKRIRPDLIFIEDNCEGLFGKYENTYAGISESTLCSSASFHGAKIITTGEGGAFFTQDKEVYDLIYPLSRHGMSEVKFIHNMFAYNYRMTNIEAAFLYDQLNDIDNILKNRHVIFKNYDNLFNDLVKINKIELLKHENDTEFSPWLYSIRIKGDNTHIQQKMLFFQEKGIDIRPFFYPINIHTHLINIENTDEISYKLNKEIFMIPSSSNITYEQQYRVYKALLEYLIYIKDINIIELNTDNKNHIFNNFLSNIRHPYFTYFENRGKTCLDKHILTIVLKDNKTNKYIGYAHIDYDKLYWFGIYIEPEYQSIKLGELLLKYILSHEKVNKIPTITLAVNKNNYAIRLYENNNFKIVNENDKYYFMELNK
jgi:dTDP-4-amino-4,6-dideoxygalactose transaminase/GNAT superfamily N-acetyltransferase